jgi:hypothetical protein
MTTHKITTEIPITFTPAGLVEQETVHPEFEITFEHRPGRPETGPTYACGGTPADPEEIEFISARVIDGDGVNLDAEQTREYAEAWLYDDGYQAALDVVQEDFERNLPE